VGPRGDPRRRARDIPLVSEPSEPVGAPNLDGHAPRAPLEWFRRITDERGSHRRRCGHAPPARDVPPA
jgi:hypothetical protein